MRLKNSHFGAEILKKSVEHKNGKLLEEAVENYKTRHFLESLNAVEKILAIEPGNPRAVRLHQRLLFGSNYPERVIVEPTNYCAMDCPVCSGRGGKVGFMPHEKFQHLMEEIGPRLKEIWLHQRGDPFYHKEIYDFIDTVGEYGIKCIMHTHGSHELDFERLISSKTRLELVFSVDGASQEGLAHYRTKADFDLVVKNMSQLITLRQETGAKYPRVTWKFIVMKRNEHEMDAAKSLAKEIGVDQFIFSEFGINWKSFELPGFKSLMEKFIPTNREYFHEDYDSAMKGTLKRRFDQSPHCFHINLVKPTIRWNGDLIPCCMCIEPHENVMGNVFKAESFESLWHSPEFREFRKQAVLSPKSLRPCDRCTITF